MGTKKRSSRGHSPTSSGGLANALFSKVQQRVLGVLFANPSRTFYAKEIIGLAHSGTGAVQRELERLEAAGIIRASRIGRQKHYQANADAPLFEELRSLTLKSFGLADVVRDALQPLATGIHGAFIYGSIAKGKDTASSDIDLLVISDRLTYSEIYRGLEAASVRLGRKVSPTLYSQTELRDRIKRRNSFVTRVLSQPKLWLIGNERVLEP
jgi:predicted nucleotidyltransferase